MSGNRGRSRRIPRLAPEQAHAVLEEVSRLARPVRAAVLLCDLQGLTQDDAAARLRCSDRTLRRRLKARTRPAAGPTEPTRAAPAAGLLATAWAAGSAPAAVPEVVAASMARAATDFTSGGTTSAMALGTAATLARALIGSMVWAKVTACIAMGAVLAFGLSAAAGLAPHKGTSIAQQSGTNKEESKTEPRAVDLDRVPPASTVSW